MFKDFDSDKTWVALVVKENDEKAFRQLFDLYYGPLVQYSTYIIRSFSLAEEIVSEVFVSLWNNRANLGEIRDFKKYIYTSTKYKTIDYIRKAKSLTFIQFDKKEFEECIVYENPEERLIEDEIRSKLEAAILKLPEKCRVIYRMVKEDQMKYSEVAELLDISPKTVENQMIIAMKRVRAAINSYYNDSECGTKAIIFSLFF